MMGKNPSIEKSSEKSVEKNEKQLAEVYELPNSLDDLSDADELPDEIDDGESTLFMENRPSQEEEGDKYLDSKIEHSDSLENTNSKENDGDDNTNSMVVSTQDVGKDGLPSNSAVEIDGEKYITDDNAKPYQKYDLTNNVWQLMQNEQYELNGYIYQTDDWGRIVSAEGKINVKDGDEGRKTINIDLQDKKLTDQRGHLIGDKFNGDNGIGNLVPMDAKLNESEFKKLENQLKDATKAGCDVYFKIEPQYNDDSKRPDSFMAIYTIDDETRERVFLNQSSQEV